MKDKEMGPKKGAILLALGKNPMGSREDDEDEEEGPRKVAAKAVMEALEDGDTDAFADAMQTLVDACHRDDSNDDY